MQWRPDDAKNPEGTGLDKLIETNNLYPLLNTLTNFREGSMSCNYLIITDQSNNFVDSSTRPSQDEHCQHQVIYGKLNVSVPYPPYKHTISEYSKACPLKIRVELESIN